MKIFQLKGKASMWWDQFVKVQHIDENKLTWRQFKKNFQKKYLTKCYNDRDMKELFELNPGSMAMDEYERRFLDMFKYVDFMKDEHFKIQRFLSGMPSIFSDKIQYDDLETLDEAIRRAKCLYEKHKGRPIFQKAWEDKKKGKMDQRKKGNKTPLFNNNS
jgi:hypothetical protein